MSERGAYRQSAGRRPRRSYDLLYDFGAALDAALMNKTQTAPGCDANGITPRDSQTSIQVMETPNNTFVPVLNEIHNGHTVIELSEKLTALISKVRATNGSAELTLKIKLKPANGGQTIRLIPTVTAKAPKEPEIETIFYSTEAGTLSRKDPNQRELELREVPQETIPLRAAV